MAERRPLVMGPAGIQELPIGDTLLMSGPRIWVGGSTVYNQGETYLSSTDWQTYRRTAATGTDTVDPANENNTTGYKYEAQYKRITQLPGDATYQTGWTVLSGIAGKASVVAFPIINQGVRTSIFRVNGKGFLDFVALRHPTSSQNVTLRFELVIDDRVVWDNTTNTSTGTGYYFNIIGNLLATPTANDRAPVFDDIPFIRSAELFVTPVSASLAASGVRQIYYSFKSAK